VDASLDVVNVIRLGVVIRGKAVVAKFGGQSTGLEGEPITQGGFGLAPAVIPA
jgi:hypothetical protein